MEDYFKMANQKLNVWDDSYENTVEKIKSLCDYLSCNYNQLLDENTELKERLNKILPASRSVNFSDENTNSLFAKSKLLDIVLPSHKANCMTYNEKVNYLNKVSECKEFLDKVVSEIGVASSMDFAKIQDVEIFINALLECARQNGMLYVDTSGITHTYCCKPVFTTPVKNSDIDTDTRDKQITDLYGKYLDVSKKQEIVSNILKEYGVDIDYNTGIISITTPVKNQVIEENSNKLQNIINVGVPILVSIISCILFRLIMKV